MALHYHVIDIVAPPHYRPNAISVFGLLVSVIMAWTLGVPRPLTKTAAHTLSHDNGNVIMLRRA